MNYGYIRVSSDKQTVENQRFEITSFCHREGLVINGWIEETVSGTKPYSKRRLGRLLKQATTGDLIICSELSRLGRSLYMIMDILSLCMNSLDISTLISLHRRDDNRVNKSSRLPTANIGC